MDNKNNTPLYLRLELLWWGIILLVACIVLAPIIFSIGKHYPFYLINVIYIVTFIMVTRYLFLLPATFLAKRQIGKITIVFLCIPFVFYLIEGIHTFQEYLDYEGILSMVATLPIDQQEGYARYIQSELLLFGVGSVISTCLFPLRLIISVWRQYNRGTV